MLFRSLYYILATQDGQITQLTKAGIGEIVKDAETIGIIVPKKIDYIAEIYVKLKAIVSKVWDRLQISRAWVTLAASPPKGCDT